MVFRVKPLDETKYSMSANACHKQALDHVPHCTIAWRPWILTAPPTSPLPRAISVPGCQHWHRGLIAEI